MIRLAVQSRLVPGASLREKRETALRLGLDGIELSGFPMAELAREALAERLPVSAMCSGHRGWLIDPDPEQIRLAIADIEELLGLGAELDAPLILVPIYGRTRFLPHCQTGRTPEEDERLFLDGMARVAAYAERVGARILLEAINRYENSVSVTLDDALRLRDAIGSPAVQVMGDVFHMNIEEAALGAALERAAPHLGYVHLADSQRLEPGRGHLDFDDVFGALVRIGYAGWASLECNLSGPAEAVLPGSVAYLRERIAAAEEASEAAAGRPEAGPW
ncbi:MAG TPA: sugar phosphate isomerase/epimerase family protein [Candidatus Limnocylindrales bacterium]|nr:sugar phosphate isomerase/epimerase family protein [Candidatus Limnocylindrales bacterium]